MNSEEHLVEALTCLTSSLVPRSIPSFSVLHAESRRAWYQNHVTKFIRMKNGQRVKMNVGEQKVSKVQGTAVHDQLEVRLRNYRAIVLGSF